MKIIITRPFEAPSMDNNHASKHRLPKSILSHKKYRTI